MNELNWIYLDRIILKKSEMKTSWFLVLLALCMAVISCSDDEGENKVSIQFKGESSNYALKSGMANNTVVSIREALIGVSEFELESETEYEYENEQTGEEYEYEMEYEIEFEGPFVVDLMSGTSKPEMALLELAPGMYTEFECEISNVLENSKSVYITGDLDINGTTYPFVYESAADFEIEIELNYTNAASVSDIWLVVVDFDYLFDGINLQEAEISQDNKVIISNNSNANLYNVISNRLHQAFEVEDDD